jgi:hypothetical protein
VHCGIELGLVLVTDALAKSIYEFFFHTAVVRVWIEFDIELKNDAGTATTAHLVLRLKPLDRLGAVKAAIATVGNNIQGLRTLDDHSGAAQGVGDALDSDLTDSLKVAISKMEIVVGVIDKLAAVRSFFCPTSGNSI